MGWNNTILKKGSQGTGVKELQIQLNKNGYDLVEDGIFGDKTETVLKDYQRKNGLAVDGIYGKESYSSLNGENGNSSTGSNATSAPTIPTFNTTATAKPTVNPLPPNPTYDSTSWDDTKKGEAALGDYNTAKDAVNNYDDFTYDEYVMGESAQAAKDALDAHNANKPGEYQSQWQTQLDELMGQIMNRDKFSYDLNGDALYQQYKDKYIQQGKLAMADTMGQAAAMTGGYGSSYAQSVGQQAYQGQLDNLNDIVPELYQMAYDRYKQEGQDLYNQYGLVMDRENTDYGRYMDTLNTWMADRDYLTGRADTEYNRDYGQYIDDRNLEYTLHQDGYNKIMDALGIAQGDYYNGADMFYTEQNNKNSVESQKFNDAMNLWNAETGQAWNEYNASEEARQYENSLTQQDYQNKNNAYWTQEEWDRDEDRYQDGRNDAATDRSESNAKDYYETGGKVGYDNGSLSDDQVKEMQEFLGINADGKWGSGSTEAAGGLTADQAWKAYQEGKLGKGDVSYADIEDDIKYYLSQNAGKDEISSYLSQALKGGYITQSEYNTLKSKYLTLTGGANSPTTYRVNSRIEQVLN